MRRSLTAAVLAAPWLVCGCTVGSGVIGERAFPLVAVSRVENASLVDVSVVAAPAGDAVLSCDDNLLDAVVTEVVADTLFVTMRPGRLYRTDSECTLLVSTDLLVGVAVRAEGAIISDGPFADFTDLRNAGTGPIRLSRLTGQRLDVTSLGAGSTSLSALAFDEVALVASGEGDVTASGAAVTVSVTVQGDGDLDARDLVTPTARADTLGAGRVDVFASRTATLRLGGSGDLHVWGSPTVDAIVTGTGQVFEETGEEAEDTDTPVSAL